MIFKKGIYNVLFVIYLLVCLLLLIYHYSKEKFELQDKKNANNENIFYLLINGDYESTYRLCEMLIHEKKIVQPLYINFHLTGCDNAFLNCKNKKKLKNNIELKIINKIFNKLRKNYTFIESEELLLPIKYISFESINDDKEFNNFFNELMSNSDIININYLTKNRNLAKKLYIISKYSLYHDINIDITLSTKERKDSKLIRYLNKNLSETIQKRQGKDDIIDAKNYILNDEKRNKSFMSNICFPLIRKTRINMKKKFNDITQLSLGCENPDFKTGNNCNKCNKCKQLSNNR